MRHTPGWEERFWSKVDQSGDCWFWTGHVTPEGYGRFWYQGRLVGPHRVLYEHTVGPIPLGIQLDHLPTCLKCCVRPDHLRLATSKQNGENRSGAYSNSKSGIRGVWWSEVRHKWCAQVCHHGKRIHVGRFDTIEEAEAAVVAKRNELYTHNDLDRVAL